MQLCEVGAGARRVLQRGRQKQILLHAGGLSRRDVLAVSQSRNGTFEDVTARSGVFDTSSKSLGVAMLDYDRDGWPDLLVANDTQPNKLYRNRRDGTFEDVAVQRGRGLQRRRQGARRHGSRRGGYRSGAEGNPSPSPTSMAK